MAQKKRQIIAVGGDSAISLANSRRHENPTLTPAQWVAMLSEDDFKLDQYILDQTQKARPRVCFLATGSGDNPRIYDAYYEVMKKFDCEPSHLSLFTGTDPHHRALLLSQDAILVHGGNTRNMLTLWKDWGVDLILREAYENGVVLAGWSAGSICWFEEGVTDSIPGTLSKLTALGFLKGSHCPHYDGDAKRRPAYHRLLLEGKIKNGVAADDRVGLHYVEGKLQKVFSPSHTQHGYSVELMEHQGEKKIKETILDRG